MIPKRSGDRVKTDRRDSLALARLHRAGELRAIYVPTDADEAMRDLVRARADAVAVIIQAKYRLKAFLLRQGRRYPGRDGWTLAYRRWLTDLRFPSPPQHIALQEYRDTIDETERRLERLTEQLRQLAPTWRWRRSSPRCKRCAVCRSSRPSRWSPSSATSRASGIPAN